MDSITEAQHSDLPYPSALLSSALHLPSRDVIPAVLTAKDVSGDNIMLMECAEELFCDEVTYWDAAWTATSAEEQAVSTLTAGPTYARENEILPAAILKLLLMLVYELDSPT